MGARSALPSGVITVPTRYTPPARIGCPSVSRSASWPAISSMLCMRSGAVAELLDVPEPDVVTVHLLLSPLLGCPLPGGAATRSARCAGPARRRRAAARPPGRLPAAASGRTRPGTPAARRSPHRSSAAGHPGYRVLRPGWRGAGRERCAFPAAARPWVRDDARSAPPATSSPPAPSGGGLDTRPEATRRYVPVPAPPGGDGPGDGPAAGRAPRGGHGGACRAGTRHRRTSARSRRAARYGHACLRAVRLDTGTAHIARVYDYWLGGRFLYTHFSERPRAVWPSGGPVRITPEMPLTGRLLTSITRSILVDRTRCWQGQPGAGPNGLRGG